MSIRTFAARLRRDEGIGLVEVLVAMMVFAFISAGVAVSLVTMTRFTLDSKNRETATNLASAKIGELLAVTTTNALQSVPVATQVVNGTTFTITTTLGWVGVDGSQIDCSTGTVQLLDKSAHVDVTWPTMVASNPVSADTILAPNARVADPTLGTIVATVKTQVNQGVAGVAISVSGTGGTAAFTTPIQPTDQNGCTVVIRVPAGTYSVGAAKSGYIAVTQTFSPTVNVSVAAAGTAKAQFQMEPAANINLRLAANSTANPLPPASMAATWINTAGSSVTNPATSPTARYPFASGYSVVAGDSTACAANDPANWPADLTHNAGIRGAIVASSPGGSSTANVPMGIITVVATDNGVIQAFAQSSVTPSCSNAASTSYQFAPASGSVVRGQSYTIALPYGSYQLKVRNANNSSLYTLITSIAVVGGVVQIADQATGGLVTTLLGGTSSVLGSYVTLDPRSVK